MSNEQQKIESRKICREFLELNNKLGFYHGPLTTFYNHYERRQLIRHGVGTGIKFGIRTNLLSIEDAKIKLDAKENNK